jgi:hypothetical protein
MQSTRSTVRGRSVAAAATLLCGVLLIAPVAAIESLADEPTSHLVISEVMTGGASASDEFIEIYNPSPATLPLEGLEVVYVTASGVTITRRADWAAGAPTVGPGEHVLVANSAGTFAAIADVVYASGIAAAGGSVALRIQGASTAIDAVGWGTAASVWMEGSAAPAPAAGETLERLPGGGAGSGQDSNDNAVDFRISSPPDPQNSTSSPVPDPAATPGPTPPASGEPSSTPVVTPTPGASTDPTPTATAPTPTPTPGGSVISILEARALGDGAAAHVRGVALTGSDFTDGGGYLDDGTGGIAVLVTGGSFARGDLVDASGEIDDRFSQRTLRVEAAGLVVAGTGSETAASPAATGSVGEALEGRLARIHATVQGAPSELTTGLAFDLDDGSGPLRVIVGSTTGIDLSGWVAGAGVEAIGVVGQRDSTGSGTVGYRLQPRGPGDVLAVVPPGDPSASPSGSGSATPSASPSGSQLPLMTIAEARSVERNERVRVRGVVTLGTGIVDDGSAVIQDASGAILLRLGEEAGAARGGQLVEVTGKRSTKSGMLSIQVTTPPADLGSARQPAPERRATGAAGEAEEGRLVVVRGAVVAGARRASSGSVSFEVDDGSGPLRVFAGASLDLDREGLVSGAWVEATGPLGQETSGSQPLRGYRIWLRTAGDLAIVAATTDPQVTDEAGSEGAGGAVSGGEASASIGDLLEGRRDDAAATVTLVAGAWPELGLAGVAWDGTRVAGVLDDAAARAILQPFLSAHPPPASATITALERAGTHAASGLPLLRLRDGGRIEVAEARPAAPAPALPRASAPSWVAVVGRMAAAGRLERDDAEPVAVTAPCAASPLHGVRGLAQVVGVGRGAPARIIVACDGVSRGPRLLGAAAAVGRGGAQAAPSPRLTPPPDGVPLVPVLAASSAMAVALVALGGVVAWRRRRPSGLDAIAEEALAQPDGPRLSLLPVHRERGSP